MTVTKKSTFAKKKKDSARRQKHPNFYYSVLNQTLIWCPRSAAEVFIKFIQSHKASLTYFYHNWEFLVCLFL